MTRLDTPTADALPDAAHAAFEQLTGASRMPPLYRQIGNSPEALVGYLGCEQALVDGVLTELDRETVKLAVSVHNRCAFCIKTHTTKAQTAGMDERDVAAIRGGEAPSDARAAAIRNATLQLLSGTELGDAERDRLSDVGVTQAGLVEIALAMAAISFTNWFNHINHTPG